RVWSTPLVGLGLRAAAELAETLRATRDTEGHDALIERVAPLVQRSVDLRRGWLSPSGHAWLAAADADAAGLGVASASGTWSTAVSAWDRAGDPYELAWARYRLAENTLRRAGVKADVAGDVQAAWTTARRLRAAALSEAVETLARRARIPLAAMVEPDAAD